MVGVEITRSSAGAWSTESSLDELAELARSAGAEIIGRLSQKLAAPARNFYIGKGKLEELVDLKDETGAETIIFDDELSPLQQRNLENALNVKVIDRAALILDIFASRAQTREGQLQVELAQHKYLLPRMAGQWQHLERLGGGIGTRGPGESQLETDRRLIRKRIDRLKKQIDQVKVRRQQYRNQRRKSGAVSVSLVGYTNAGKSTLLNALTTADASVGDRLFATLDPITRRLHLPEGGTLLLSDTVGFIRKLPPTIATAFRATLEELDEADMLVHVVDVASPAAERQCQTVEKIIDELGLAEKPRLTVLNKIDRLLPEGREWTEADAFSYLEKTAPTVTTARTIFCAAVKGWGLERIRDEITEMLQLRKW